MYELDALAQRRAMKKCRMDRLPTVTGNPLGERTSGTMICDICYNVYRDHPIDDRIVGYAGPYLHILCDGSRVKL